MRLFDRNYVISSLVLLLLTAPIYESRAEKGGDHYNFAGVNSTVPNGPQDSSSPGGAESKNPIASAAIVAKAGDSQDLARQGMTGVSLAVNSGVSTTEFPYNPTQSVINVLARRQQQAQQLANSNHVQPFVQSMTTAGMANILQNIFQVAPSAGGPSAAGAAPTGATTTPQIQAAVTVVQQTFDGTVIQITELGELEMARAVSQLGSELEGEMEVSQIEARALVAARIGGETGEELSNLTREEVEVLQRLGVLVDAIGGERAEGFWSEFALAIGNQDRLALASLIEELEKELRERQQYQWLNDLAQAKIQLVGIWQAQGTWRENIEAVVEALG